MEKESRKEKKAYEAPAFKAVHLEVIDSLLGNCHTSSNLTVLPNCALSSSCIAP